MSYDFTLLAFSSGTAPQDIELAFGNLVGEECAHQGSIAKLGAEVINQELCSALTKADKSLELFQKDYAEIVRCMNISVAEARREFDYIELNCNIFGIQIQLWAETISITMPFWYREPRASEAFVRIWEYLNVLYSAGFIAMDDQIGKILYLETDLPVVLNAYLSVIESMSDLIEKAHKANNTPSSLPK